MTDRLTLTRAFEGATKADLRDLEQPGQAFEQRLADGNAFGDQFALREAQYISDDFIDINGQLFRRCVSRHRADTRNDLAGPLSVGSDLFLDGGDCVAARSGRTHLTAATCPARC